MSAYKQLENPWEDFREVSKGVPIRFTDTFLIYLNYNTHAHKRPDTWRRGPACICVHIWNVTHTKYSFARKIFSKQIVSYLERNTLFALGTLFLASGGFREFKDKQEIFLMLHRNCESFDWFCRNSWVYLSRIINLLANKLVLVSNSFFRPIFSNLFLRNQVD